MYGCCYIWRNDSMCLAFENLAHLLQVLNIWLMSFLHLEVTLTFAKLCYAFKEKLFSSVTRILWKKVILSCLKTNLKISHNLRLPDIFVKRFKPSKRYIATAELVKPPIWYLFKPLIMFKEDCFGLRNGGGGCLHVRGELFQIP